MAPVKQEWGGLDVNALVVERGTLRGYDWHEMRWETPSYAELTEALRRELTDAYEQIKDLRERARMWKIAYLTVCVQFAVVTVAAVWGWTR